MLMVSFLTYINIPWFNASLIRLNLKKNIYAYLKLGFVFCAQCGFVHIFQS